MNKYSFSDLPDGVKSEIEYLKTQIINNYPSLSLTCIHGRFQPFHFGHLAYTLSAYSVSDMLYIGITNPDPTVTALDKTSTHRHLTEANPFPYFARMEMILGTLTEIGVEMNKIRVIPYPINCPELLKYYVPNSSKHIITLYDEWSERKIQLLKDQGFSTLGLKGSLPKLTSGTKIRELLKAGQSISQLVSPFVASYIQNNPI